jgi:hypothetical protein
LITFAVSSRLKGETTAIGFAAAVSALAVKLLLDVLFQMHEVAQRLGIERAVAALDSDFLAKYVRKLVRRHESMLTNVADHKRLQFESRSAMMEVYYDVFRTPEVSECLATSMVAFDGVWETPYGARALSVNRDAVARGAKLKRIFILGDGQQPSDPDLLNHVAKHVAAGIVVRYVRAGVLDPGQRRDFLVTNNNFVLQYTMGAGGDINECILTCDAATASQCRELFGAIDAVAQDFTLSSVGTATSA